MDGLTSEQCRERWVVNRELVELTGITPYQLTTAQIYEGRRASIERNSRYWSRQLRALVAASAAEGAARATSVQVTPELDPWD